MKKPDWMRMVRSGEGLQVEFKLQAPKLIRISKTFSAFANSSGGWLFFGVSDEGEMVGLEHPAGTRELVEQVGLFFCRPEVVPICEDWEPIRGTKILVAYIPEATVKPVYAVNPNNEKDAWPFFRSDKENLPLDRKGLKTMRHTVSDPIESRMDELDRNAVRILERLNQTPRLTLGQLARTLNISDHRTKKILVHLERNGWVHSFFNEKSREFSLAVPYKKV